MRKIDLAVVQCSPVGEGCCPRIRSVFRLSYSGVRVFSIEGVYGVSSQRRGPVVVGVLVAALVAGPAWASVPNTESAHFNSTGSVPGSSLAAKKKSSKGTLVVTVSGSGSYTVIGKGFRKTGMATKSFKVKPGTYTIKAATGSVKPGKAKVRKGKTVRVTVTFAGSPAPAPSTPSPPPPVNPTPPPVTPTPTPTPTPPPSSDVVGATQWISTDALGNEVNRGSGWDGAAWSPDGTRIAFSSNASNLVPGDTNDRTDIFVKTLATGAIQRISTDVNGQQSSGGPDFGGSYDAAWSPDGTKIAFTSSTVDLVPGDTNASKDVFVKTVATGAIQRISTDAAGLQVNGGSFNPVWSPDGTRIAFVSESSGLVASDTNNGSDLFVKTLANASVQRISTDSAGLQASGSSFNPAWSPDGTRIAFLSGAANLVSGDTNGVADVFTKNLTTSAVQRVSTAGNGDQASGESYDRPAWSPDGSKIAFSSYANNLVPGDTNTGMDVFVKDLSGGGVQRVSTTSSGGQANNGGSRDPGSYHARWSPDGTHVAFNSDADNLVPVDTNNTSDVFLKNVATGAVKRASTTASGGQSDGFSFLPEWSPDGTRLLFTSEAGNLVSGKTVPFQEDVFTKSLG